MIVSATYLGIIVKITALSKIYTSCKFETDVLKPSKLNYNCFDNCIKIQNPGQRDLMAIDAQVTSGLSCIKL
jgi:hypothetical protein